MTDRFHESKHPLVKHKLAFLRKPEREVGPKEYADLLRELGILLTVEATQDFPFLTFTGNWPVIIPMVRSGLVMAEGVRHILPSRYIGHIGLVYHHDSRQMVDFMVTLPPSLEERYCIIVDPFVVSGETAKTSIKILYDYGVAPERILFLTACMSRSGKAFLKGDKWAGKARFFCGHIDEAGDEWIDSFKDLNHRLYGTRNRRLERSKMGEP